MRSRLVRLFTLLTLLAAPLVVASSTQPAIAGSNPYCELGRPAPCVVSATRDGIDLRDLTAPQNVWVDFYSDPPVTTGFQVTGSTVSDVGHRYSVTMDTGSIKPRTITAKGQRFSTKRWFDTSLGHWMVKVVLGPRKILTTCDKSDVPICPETAPQGNWAYQMSVLIDDGSWYSDSADEADGLHGLDHFGNLNTLQWYHPSITTAPSGTVTTDFSMLNSRYQFNGNPALGKASLRIPNRVLRGLYNIPDPETMTVGSFSSTSSSGTISSFQESGNDAWRVELSGMTFPSEQHLILKRGKIAPLRPTAPHATRIDADTGRVTYTLAKARGARPTGYEISCESGGGHLVANVKNVPTSPIQIAGLQGTVAYDCRVRATSEAGPGAWSKVVRIAARP